MGYGKLGQESPLYSNETLAEALPKEQQRVRDLLPVYDAIPTGIFAATMMRHSLRKQNAHPHPETLLQCSWLITT